MYRTRKIGFGLALTFGLMLTVPAMAQDPAQSAINHIAQAQATLAQIKQLGDGIKARHAMLEANVSVSSDEGAPLKCPACGMMMPTKPTATMTRSVKYGGKTYYCCKGCDMSATADKE